MARTMTEHEQTVLMFKGLVAQLPDERQKNVRDVEEKLRAILAEYPGGEALLAFGLIMAEMQKD